MVGTAQNGKKRLIFIVVPLLRIENFRDGKNNMQTYISLSLITKCKTY